MPQIPFDRVTLFYITLGDCVILYYIILYYIISVSAPDSVRAVCVIMLCGADPVPPSRVPRGYRLGACNIIHITPH